MIGYVTLGTNDFECSARFYDGLLAVIGARRYMESDSFIAWGFPPDRPALSITRPFNGEAATAGNGTMVALVVKDQATVDALHAKAMELGATDEGAPGPRGPTFYAGYFRDPDGNKLNAFVIG